MSLFNSDPGEPQKVDIPPQVTISSPPRYAHEAHETKRLQAISYLGPKWCLAATRKAFLDKLNPPKVELV